MSGLGGRSTLMKKKLMRRLHFYNYKIWYCLVVPLFYLVAGSVVRVLAAPYFNFPELLLIFSLICLLLFIEICKA